MRGVCTRTYRKTWLSAVVSACVPGSRDRSAAVSTAAPPVQRVGRTDGRTGLVPSAARGLGAVELSVVLQAAPAQPGLGAGYRSVGPVFSSY